MTYQELKQKHTDEFSAIPVIWAFSDKQMAEGLAKHGLTTSKEDLGKICSIGGGGYMLKTEAPKLKETINRHCQEMDEAFNDPVFLKEALRYELSNHEFCITYDHTDTLDALGLSRDDPRVKAVIKTTTEQYLRGAEEGG